MSDIPQNADVEIVFVKSPEGITGYDLDERNNGGNGYVPISLKYDRYTAIHARNTSLADGSPFENFTTGVTKEKP